MRTRTLSSKFMLVSSTNLSDGANAILRRISIRQIKATEPDTASLIEEKMVFDPKHYRYYAVWDGLKTQIHSKGDFMLFMKYSVVIAERI